MESSGSLHRLVWECKVHANSTRPDISYSVNRLAAYTTNPGLQHHSAIKQILRYLAGTKTLGITYRKSQDGTKADNLFHGYADAAYANTKDLKSTTGYVFLAGGEPLHGNPRNKLWLHFPQPKQNMWDYQKLDARQCGWETYMENSDIPKRNQPWLKVTTTDLWFWCIIPNSINDPSTLLFTIIDNVVDIQNCRNPEQTTDVLTKALPKPKHLWHQEEMGIQSNRKPGSFPCMWWYFIPQGFSLHEGFDAPSR